MNTISRTIAEMFGLPADWIVSMAPQGSTGWLDARRGCATGSMAKVAREKLKNGNPSKAAETYARDTARARAGAGNGDEVYVNAAMRFGTEQEPHARQAYEIRTGYMVEAAGFVCTPDRKIGVSVDGLVFDEPGQRGGVEIKTIVSSNVLFESVIGGDYSAYVDQCDLNTWAWCLDWIDLCLWSPDLATPDSRLTVIRIWRNQDLIDALLLDLAAFDVVVEGYAETLREFMGGAASSPTKVEPGSTPAPPAVPAPAVAAVRKPAASPVELTEAAF
jgi:hypothetical protein